MTPVRSLKPGEGKAEEVGVAPAADGAALRWRVMRPGSPWRPGPLRELWEDRELGLVLALRDLQLRYRQTYFGIAWAVLQPLVAMGIFSVIFGSVADIPRTSSISATSG